MNSQTLVLRSFPEQVEEMDVEMFIEDYMYILSTYAEAFLNGYCNSVLEPHVFVKGAGEGFLYVKPIPVFNRKEYNNIGHSLTTTVMAITEVDIESRCYIKDTIGGFVIFGCDAVEDPIDLSEYMDSTNTLANDTKVIVGDKEIGEGIEVDAVDVFKDGEDAHRILELTGYTEKTNVNYGVFLEADTNFFIEGNVDAVSLSLDLKVSQETFHCHFYRDKASGNYKRRKLAFDFKYLKANYNLDTMKQFYQFDTINELLECRVAYFSGLEMLALIPGSVPEYLNDLVNFIWFNKCSQGQVWGEVKSDVVSYGVSVNRYVGDLNVLRLSQYYKISPQDLFGGNYIYDPVLIAVIPKTLAGIDIKGMSDAHSIIASFAYNTISLESIINGDLNTVYSNGT